MTPYTALPAQDHACKKSQLRATLQGDEGVHLQTPNGIISMQLVIMEIKVIYKNFSIKY